MEREDRGFGREVFTAMQQLYDAGSYRKTADAGWQQLRMHPGDAKLLHLLGLAEHRLGNHAAGVVLLRRAIRAEPSAAAYWNDLGNVYCAGGDLVEGEEAYATAARLNPACAEAWNNLGVMAGDREDYEAARTFYERALELRPNYADALYNLGIALAGIGRFQKALHRYEQAMALRPEHQSTRFNIALTRLLLGDFTGGWKEWEARWHSPQLASSLRQFEQPAWKGGRLAGKRILLHAEQGLGDTLQFVRYVPKVAELGASIVLEVQKPLVSLFRAQIPLVGPGTQVVGRGEELPRFDLHCSLMSLPGIFQTVPATVPHPEGYLAVAPEASLQGKRGLNIGFVWAGSPTHKRDRHRSMPLGAFRPLLDVPGITWTGLQKGSAAAGLMREPEFARMENLGEGFQNYEETAKAIAALDLVISVDTSVAHLAGAMGKPVWVLLDHHPDWRWMLKRKDSPWYRSARLFRQPSPGDWDGVVRMLVSALDARQGRWPPAVPAGMTAQVEPVRETDCSSAAT